MDGFKEAPIVYVDRSTGQEKCEKVYGKKALQFLYGDEFLSRLIGAPLLHLSARIPFFSALYGWWQKRGWSRKKIAPFIKNFEVDATEFLDPPETYLSFNDFFIRKLKPEARPIAAGDNAAIIPADGRYLFYPDLTNADGFRIKGEKFSLHTLLEDENLSREYEHGTLIIGRLCPSDYHRFHFPCDCVPTETRTINGWLFSVNPWALKKALARDVDVFTQNKRSVCILHSEAFGKVLYLEIGATAVGTIHETYSPYLPQRKGSEKGYFSFGASALVLLFPPGSLQLAEDLLQYPRHQEILCKMGQILGYRKNRI